MTEHPIYTEISIEDLNRQAPNRPPGYVEDCLSQGEFDGEYLRLTPAAYEALRAKYSGGVGRCMGCGS